MDVRLVQLPQDLTAADVVGRHVVVIDTLRATTTIAHALHAGAAAVEPVADLDDARRRKAADPDVILAGERRCVRVNGFDLGNSPAELTPAAVAGRRVVLTTTNGTTALAAVGEAAAGVYTAALVNAAATADRLRGHPVTLLSAGTDGNPAAEDDAAARFIAAHLAREPVPDVDAAVRGSEGAANLRRTGHAADVELVLRRDTLPVVCRMTDGVIYAAT